MDNAIAQEQALYNSGDQRAYTVNSDGTLTFTGGTIDENVPDSGIAPDNGVAVTAQSQGAGGSGNQRPTAMTGLSLTSDQFAAWVKQMNQQGGFQAPPASTSTIDSNSGVAAAAAKVPTDPGGPDTVENPALDAFMQSIKQPLESLNVGGGDPEKFITVGQNDQGQYIITSVQIIGSQGGTNLWIPSDAVAIAHTHPVGAYQAPNGADDSYLFATGKPSFEIGVTGSNLFEIERNQGAPSIRVIQPSNNFGQWEKFQADPTRYRIYSDSNYPAYPNGE
ncbi:MAG TPA: hypothetical protein VHZ26_08545 [Caulobacteraceae bacterium]|jgi:hypothetical protein|nr:hypothetical protein [Caulobacteraceae bacterium]